MRIGDRVIIIRNGTTFTEFGPDASQADVLAAAAGQLSAEQERALALKDAS
jgi:rhamnose transport system ATP-binding protein